MKKLNNFLLAMVMPLMLLMINPVHADGLSVTHNIQVKDEDDNIVTEFDFEIGEWRRGIMAVAIDSVGRIRYDLGSKAPQVGYWDKDGRMRLDCSSYVSWVLDTVFDTGHMEFTTATLPDFYNLKEINHSELKPGDLGFRAIPGTKSNHVGIYAGKNKEGHDMWIHCSSVQNNIGTVLNDVEEFHYYYSVDSIIKKYGKEG